MLGVVIDVKGLLAHQRSANITLHMCVSNFCILLAQAPTIPYVPVVVRTTLRRWYNALRVS